MNIQVILLTLFLVSSGICEYKSAPYAEWAHSHVIWLNANQQNQAKIEQLVQTYQSYDIPVGGVNIDSGWSTCYNDFVFNRTKFPNPQKLVSGFHAQGIKVVLWATSMVNNDCSIYQEGVDRGYFLNNGQLAKWWHGSGAFIDFTNPQAKAWWFKLMDRALDMGFDGWKTDGTDPLIIRLTPFPYSNYNKRPVGIHEYGHQYYGSFYNYTKSRTDDALIMSRPVDSLKNKFFLSYSPKYVMFSGWVGDQDSSAAGFQEAMVNVLHSASKGYLSFGFDIGGYRGQAISKAIYLRWMQTGALLPFMENGGNGKHQPWKFDTQTVQIYRKFVLLHYDLKAFFLTAGTEAYAKKVSIIQPLVRDSKTAELSHSSNLGFLLWDTFLVFPILEESGLVKLYFPKGKWVYYFNRSKIYNGESVDIRAFDLSQTPLFLKTNSVVPIKDELWLIHLSARFFIRKTILHGPWSDNIEVSYDKQVLRVTFLRYYKDKSEKTEEKLAVRFVGVTQVSQIKIKTSGQETSSAVSVDNEGQGIFLIDAGHQYEFTSVQYSDYKTIDDQ